EPLAVAFHTLRRGGVAPGDTVAIVGAGPIGLGVLLAARAIGAGRVFVVEPADRRRALASELGASLTFDPRDPDIVRQVFRATDGIGADVVVECVGRPDTAPLAVELARRGGRVVIAGIFEESTTIQFNRVVFYEKQILGSIAYAGEFPTVIALLADGRLDPTPLITGRIGLENILSQGFDELLRNRDRHVKILVSPNLETA
ncbi:MAG: zinc-binding dehydrogenase, partial [Chloroflexi bacterium]|nr:zinc-binding dehydrogenase [Chloroflexota bacterium]